jgi:hypothetical protein
MAKKDSTIPVFNPNDANGVRDGGPYLDQVELVQAETRRAAVEGREPNYDNLQPTAGVPAVTEAQLANISTAPKFETPNPIGETSTPVNADAEVASNPKTDTEKIAVAQKKALDKDETPVDAVEVSKAVSE